MAVRSLAPVAQAVKEVQAVLAVTAAPVALASMALLPVRPEGTAEPVVMAALEEPVAWEGPVEPRGFCSLPAKPVAVCLALVETGAMLA